MVRLLFEYNEMYLLDHASKALEKKELWLPYYHDLAFIHSTLNKLDQMSFSLRGYISAHFLVAKNLSGEILTPL